MNLVTLIGRLTADPDLRFINTGTAISKFSIAIDRSYRKDNQAVTDFIPVEIWGKKAEYCATYIEKGCLVAVSGSLHIDRYTDSGGNNRNFAKVVANSIMKLNSPNKSANIENSDTSVSGDGSFGSEVASDGNNPSSRAASNPADNTALVNNNPIANLTEYADDDLPF